MIRNTFQLFSSVNVYPSKRVHHHSRYLGHPTLHLHHAADCYGSLGQVLAMGTGDADPLQDDWDYPGQLCLLLLFFHPIGIPGQIQVHHPSSKNSAVQHSSFLGIWPCLPPLHHPVQPPLHHHQAQDQNKPLHWKTAVFLL